MRTILIALVLLGSGVGGCGSDEQDPAGSGGQGATSGQGGAGSSGGIGGTSGMGGTGGQGGTSGEGGTAGDSGLSPLCQMLFAKLEQCGIAAPAPSKCKADNACEDTCTLTATCEEIAEIVRGRVPPSIETCFEGCP